MIMKDEYVHYMDAIPEMKQFVKEREVKEAEEEVVRQ
jgi:hypothetical protein